MEQLRQFEVPGVVTIASGSGGLPKINIRTERSAAEIYLHGAHVTCFQKNGEEPLLFLSRKSRFTPGEAIRGGVPICFPWFGPREGEPAHGFARVSAWELTDIAAKNGGSVTARFQLPKAALKAEWSALRTKLAVTITDKLMMELITTNESAEKVLEIENCLHTYFYTGDISTVSIAGLQGLPFDDFAAGAGGALQAGDQSALRITQETNRVYPNATGTVEIRDENLQRTVRVEKFGSHSTVVWNPWTTQKMPDDFDPAEHQNMVCVESGNVKQNKILLAPGKTTALKVVLSSTRFER